MIEICVSLTEPTTARIIDRMADLAGTADLFEIRGDLVTDLDLLTILRAKTRPLLFTCRAVSEGGQAYDHDPRRRLALLEAVKRGYDYVDVEFRSGLRDVMAEMSGRGLVVSYHDLEGMPADLDRLYAEMVATGADYVKIAVTPSSIADVGRLLDLAARTAQGGGKPLLPVALGPLGLPSRLLAGRYHAPFTYASAAEGSEAGAGQLPAALMADLYRVREVTRATRVYGIVGTDVTRSLSPFVHNRAFAARQMDAIYIPLQAEALKPFLSALPALDLAGFSVTRPYKTEILPHLQAVEETAALAGSVNTVVVQDGQLQGSSSDGHGILVPLKKMVDVKGKKVIVLGAGGAARAAALALRRKGARVTVLARHADQAAGVGKAVGAAHGTLEGLAQEPWDVLINATPVGSGAEAGQSLVPRGLHRPGSVVFDMVYDPVETKLLREAKAAGCRTIVGLDMLVAQAVAQFETWTGSEAPVDVMQSAAFAAYSGSGS